MGRDSNLALAYGALYNKDHQSSRLDDALEAVDGALEEYRKANSAVYIDNAERLQKSILAVKGKL